MSHTPGPWKIHFYDDITKCPMTVDHAEGEPSWEYLQFQIATKQADRFAEVIVGEVQARNAQNGGWPTVNDWDECRANARLIAAAPEMLEALEEALELLTYHYDGDGRYHSLDRPNGQTDTDCEFCRLAVQAETILTRIKETTNA